MVVLESGDAPNLKMMLKNIIRGAVTNTEGNDGYQSFLTDRDVGLPSPRTVAWGGWLIMNPGTKTAWV